MHAMLRYPPYMGRVHDCSLMCFSTHMWCAFRPKNWYHFFPPLFTHTETSSYGRSHIKTSRHIDKRSVSVCINGGRKTPACADTKSQHASIQRFRMNRSVQSVLFHANNANSVFLNIPDLSLLFVDRLYYQQFNFHFSLRKELIISLDPTLD